MAGAFWGSRVLEIVKKHDSGGLVWKRIKLTSTRKANAKKRLHRVWQGKFHPRGAKLGDTKFFDFKMNKVKEKMKEFAHRELYWFGHKSLPTFSPQRFPPAEIFTILPRFSWLLESTIQQMSLLGLQAEMFFDSELSLPLTTRLMSRVISMNSLSFTRKETLNPLKVLLP